MKARASLVVAALAMAGGAVAAAPSSAATVHVGRERVVVTAPGARAVIKRSPFRLTVADARGRAVLRQVAGRGSRRLTVPTAVRNVSGLNGPIGPPRRALYAPLAFLVGSQRITQTPSGIFSGNLAAVEEGGREYAARSVISVRRVRGGVRMLLATSDPSGRKLVALVRAGPRRGSLQVSVRPTPAAGVAAMSDAFASPRREAFRGFGGRHDELDQRGSSLLNWIAQENQSSATVEGLVAPVPGTDRDTLFPNGEEAAYYAQSSFVSSAGYGFLLDRDELSDWRLASDRRNAWRVQAAGRRLDYVVAPGSAPRAVRTLTAITGRHLVPPAWAVGPAFDREVKFPLDPPDQYAEEIAQDLRDFDRYGLPLDSYRMEGWQFLPRPVLSDIIAQLRRRGIHPMVYFRAFVGLDTIGTDDPAAYTEAVAKGYVATHADGSPYIFTTNFGKPGAVIDFTDPAAVRWWQGRIRAALDLGADGFMQDFGEQVQSDMHFHNGATGATMHNRLPVLFHRATRRAVQAFERDHPKREIYFFTRAGYSGTPGSAAYENANFPGDETTDWSHSGGLASLATDMLNRAIGGAYGYTTDVGGYYDAGPWEVPTSKELFLRWAQWAALSPHFRLHGAIVAGVHTPWSYDAETVRLYNDLSRLHRRAAPLILRLWRQARRTGIPVTRPLWMAEPRSAAAARADQQWLLGPDLLVAPVVQKGAVARTVYFPRGCWQRAGGSGRYRGPRSARVEATLSQLPYFVRCGTRPLGS